jgi:glucokinase
MKGALVNAAGGIVARSEVPTPSGEGVDAVIETVIRTVSDLIARGQNEGLDIPAAGVVVPGIVDDANGIAVFSANLGWRNLPLRTLLQSRLGVPVAFGHDVRTGGLAEARFGAARGVRDAVFLPIGTGIAAATLVGGDVVTGDGYAGELGHVVVEPDGDPCRCGGRGCLESVASARAIVRRYSERTGHHLVDAAQVAQRVVDGDPDARDVWDDAIHALADVLAPCVALLAPEIVVIGGGLGASGEVLLGALRHAIEARLPCQRRPRLVQAQLGIWAGCVGAAILGWETHTGTATARGGHVR